MASRRLAISSLLCEDDAPPPALPQPQPPPPSLPPIPLYHSDASVLPPDPAHQFPLPTPRAGFRAYDAVRDELDSEHKSISLARPHMLPYDPTDQFRYNRPSTAHHTPSEPQAYVYQPPHSSGPTFASYAQPGPSALMRTPYTHSRSPDGSMSPVRSPATSFSQYKDHSSASPGLVPRRSPSSITYIHAPTHSHRPTIGPAYHSDSTSPPTSIFDTFAPHATHSHRLSLSLHQGPIMSNPHPSMTSPVPPNIQPPSPMGGLDALVQAAAEERRRLSGGSEEPGHHTTNLRASISPILTRPSGFRPEPQQAFHPPPYPLGSVESHVQQMDVSEAPERPRKKRRTSESVEANDSTGTRQRAPSASGKPPAQPAPDPSKPVPAPALKPKPKRAPRKSAAAKKKEAAAQNDARAKSESHAPAPAPAPAPEQTMEQDAHEWLLDHYGASSSVPSPPGLTAPPPAVPTNTNRAGGKGRARGGSASAPKRQRGGKAKEKAQPQAQTQARTPTPVTALVDELTDESPTRAPTDADVDADIEGALGLLDDETAVTPGGMDVEDELLSLVDDNRDREREREREGMRPPPPVRRASPSVLVGPGSYSAVRNEGGGRAGGRPERESMLPRATAERESMPPRATSERESMPPPATTGSGRKVGRGMGAPKKEVGSKTEPKPKPAPKPRKKPAAPKTKSKPSKEEKVGAEPQPQSASAPSKKGSGSGSPFTVPPRAKSSSRSASLLPGAGDSEKEQEEEEEKVEDDKLYCVCRTRYDEERVMIACDRCDEWYHTQCVSMDDLEVDLVDQFICPKCVESNPHLSLRTTYKERCLAGLKHPDPFSRNACHKPARGAFSKYCSDDCGMKRMQARINEWARTGGDKEVLWESLKRAEKREGVVVCVKPDAKDGSGVIKTDSDGSVPQSEVPVNGHEKHPRSRREREVERLRTRLNKLMQTRELMKMEMDIVLWREKLVYLALRRAEGVGECGWDQRLCFGDEEIEEFGEGVLESYEETLEELDGGDGAGMEHGAWWCRGRKKCDRHAGWQKLREAEVQHEKEMKESAIAKLTTQERELRKRVEDLLDPEGRANGHSKSDDSKAVAAAMRPAANGASHSKTDPQLAKKVKRGKEAL